jgi:hypothetical protein
MEVFTMSNVNKKLFSNISFQASRYAPEQFKLFLFNKPVVMTHNTTHKLGYTLATKGKAELLKEIKKLFRSKAGLFKTKESCLLVIPQKHNDNEYIYINLQVKRYDIQEKLYVYKELKRVLKDTNYVNPVKIESVQLDGNYKPINKKDQTEILELSNRVRLITA